VSMTDYRSTAMFVAQHVPTLTSLVFIYPTLPITPHSKHTEIAHSPDPHSIFDFSTFSIFSNSHFQSTFPPYPSHFSYHLTNLRHSVHISDTFDIRVSCIHTYFERFISNYTVHTFLPPFRLLVDSKGRSHVFSNRYWSGLGRHTTLF